MLKKRGVWGFGVFFYYKLVFWGGRRRARGQEEVAPPGVQLRPATGPARSGGHPVPSGAKRPGEQPHARGPAPRHGHGSGGRGG